MLPFLHNIFENKLGYGAAGVLEPGGGSHERF